MHLRPYATFPDDHFPTGDLRAYNQIGEVATQLTGYPAVSVFHDFAYDPKTKIRGSAHDFMYDQRGVFSWTTEFWSPQRQAGLEDYKYIEWLRDHPPEDDLKLYRWQRDKLGGRSQLWWGTNDATTDRAKLEWVIEAPNGGELQIKASHERAGVVRTGARLE
jgi:hypothetical protein